MKTKEMTKKMPNIFRRFWNWLTGNKEQNRYSFRIYLVRRPDHKDLSKYRAINAQIWTGEKISQEDMKYESLRWAQDNLPEYYQPSEDIFPAFYSEKIDKKQAKRLGIDDEKYHISSEPLSEEDYAPDETVEEPNQKIPVKQEERLELRL
jgi:hypothetical protein